MTDILNKTQIKPTLPPLLADIRPKVTSPRVLMVAVRYYPFMGGVETHIYEAGRRLAANGLDLTVITHDPDGKLPDEEIVNGVRILRIKGWPSQRDFCIAPDLVRQIESGNWDIVHCQGYHTLFTPLAMAAAWKAGVPYVLSFHSGGHSSRLRNAVRGIQRQVLRPLLAHAERLVAVSGFEAEFFQKKLNLPASKFVVIPNGAKMPELSTPVTVDTNTELILSVGRLEQYKGHHRIIAALPYILRERPNVRLRIAGSGPYETALRRQVADLGLQDKVEIGAVPPQDREGLARLLAQAKLVTLLSDYEAHPIAVMEALSLQRPVLAAHTSGLAELADKKLVRSIPLKSSSIQVAEAVLYNLDNPFVPDAFELPTWEKCAAELQQLYTSIAKSGRE